MSTHCTVFHLKFPLKL